MKVNWNFPNIIWSGENRINDLFLACSELNIKKPLFVTDKDLINLKIVKNVINELKNNLNDIKIFSDYSGNPIGENVEEGVIKKANNPVKILGNGDITKPIEVSADMFSKTAIEKIEKITIYKI